MRGHIAATALVALGFFYLLRNLNVIQLSLWQLLKRWWPSELGPMLIFLERLLPVFDVWWPIILIAIGLSLFLKPRGSDRW